MNAFKQFLMNQDPIEATQHVIECLKGGSPNSEAWTLMSDHYGDDWKCPPEHLPSLVLAVIYRLKYENEAPERCDYCNKVRCICDKAHEDRADYE